MQKEIRTVTFKLTADDINTRAHRLAEVLSEKVAIVTEKKAVMSGYKEQIEQKEGLIQHLTREITSGEITEDVMCIVEKDYEAGVKQYFHEGVLVDTVPLSVEDRQLSIQ